MADHAEESESGLPKVAPFLEVRIERIEDEADLLGLCAGYELGAWRATQFASYLSEHLPQFALPIEEWDNINSATAVRQLARAARTIYTTPKYQNRGEVGELLLFAIMREFYDSIPIISKFYFKSSSNDTVKGFDAVHVVLNNGNLELWLGEVKFYSNISAAVRDVIAELHDHLETNFLREEFMWIDHKIGDEIDKVQEIRGLLDAGTSLDEVFAVLNIPVLLTYRSPTINGHSAVDDTYLEAIASELSSHFDSFRSKTLPTKVAIHLFLVPLEGKARLLKAFDDKLKALQAL